MLIVANKFAHPADPWFEKGLKLLNNVSAAVEGLGSMTIKIGPKNTTFSTAGDEPPNKSNKQKPFPFYDYSARLTAAAQTKLSNDAYEALAGARIALVPTPTPEGAKDWPLRLMPNPNWDPKNVEDNPEATLPTDLSFTGNEAQHQYPDEQRNQQALNKAAKAVIDQATIVTVYLSDFLGLEPTQATGLTEDEHKEVNPLVQAEKNIPAESLTRPSYDKYGVVRKAATGGSTTYKVYTNFPARQDDVNPRPKEGGTDLLGLANVIEEAYAGRPRRAGEPSMATLAFNRATDGLPPVPAKDLHEHKLPAEGFTKVEVDSNTILVVRASRSSRKPPLSVSFPREATDVVNGGPLPLFARNMDHVFVPELAHRVGVWCGRAGCRSCTTTPPKVEVEKKKSDGDMMDVDGKEAVDSAMPFNVLTPTGPVYKEKARDYPGVTAVSAKIAHAQGMALPLVHKGKEVSQLSTREIGSQW